jgi:hypothetical protein
MCLEVLLFSKKIRSVLKGIIIDILYKCAFNDVSQSKSLKEVGGHQRGACSLYHFSNALRLLVFKESVLLVQTCLPLLTDVSIIETSCPYFEHLIRKIKCYPLQYVIQVV